MVFFAIKKYNFHQLCMYVRSEKRYLEEGIRKEVASLTRQSKRIDIWKDFCRFCIRNQCIPWTSNTSERRWQGSPQVCSLPGPEDTQRVGRRRAALLCVQLHAAAFVSQFLCRAWHANVCKKVKRWVQEGCSE